MSYPQENTPIKLQLDKAPASLTKDEAMYLLNCERAVGGINGSLTDTIPLAANYPAGQIAQPVGENYAIGSHKDPITNETYSWIFNEHGIHYVQRLSDKHGLEVVYDGECLELSADPKHAIEDFRAVLRLDDVYDRDGQGCKNRAGKSLIWTDGLHDIGCIDVEASIATNSFTTPFFDICPDPCAMIQLCVPDPCGAITAEFVPRTPDSIGLTNKLLNAAFKLRFRWVYYDERASEWSDISSPYFLDDTNGCFQNEDALPRCLKLRLPIGNPMVDRIEVAFSIGDKGDLTFNDGFNDVWYLYDTIQKYKKYNSNQQQWYERGLSELITSPDANYDPDTCMFDYIFCNDKECNPIDFKETSRVFNPLPIQPQGILRIKESNLGFYNYRAGNCPVDRTEIEKFKVNVDCQPDSCDTEYVTVKVRAVLLTSGGGTFNIGPVFRNGGTYGGDDDEADPAQFGGSTELNAGDQTITFIPAAKQKFPLGKRNFTAYIEGSDYFVEMTQWVANNGFVNNKEVGIYSGFGDYASVAPRINNAINDTDFNYQEAIFRVPKGTSGIIRIMSHLSKIPDDTTSTYVLGSVPLQQIGIHGYFGNFNDIFKPHVKEIEFDTCNGSVDIKEALVIRAWGKEPHGSGDASYVFDGYITDANGRPVPDCVVSNNGVVRAISDFNGYYFFSDDPLITCTFSVEKDCSAFKVVESISLSGVDGTVVSVNMKIRDVDYGNGFYETVNVSVEDCNGQKIKGVTIALSKDKAQVTDQATGIATFRVRNHYLRNKKVRAYVMDKNGCFTMSCNGICNPCLPKTNEITLQPCFQPNPPSPPNTGPVINLVTNDRLNITGINNRRAFLKRGGRYPWAIAFKGRCPKISAAYELPYIDIPKMQTTGTSSGCIISYDANGLVPPAWADCAIILRGENQNAYQLQWVIDKIEKTTDRKIKLTIQSLNDYNEQYLFKTNTVYQWLKGDRIEFIRDHNGVIIPASQHGILNYLTVSPFHDTLVSGRTDADINYFNQLLIEDDGKLDFIKEGSLIEIQRAKECTTEPVYFQIASIPIENGQLLYPTGTIDTFDTYIKKRNISGTTIQIFEHHSPSDFWGHQDNGCREGIFH